ncbi:11944_t:CDS:2, partial [Gigaspora margarita]
HQIYTENLYTITRLLQSEIANNELVTQDSNSEFAKVATNDEFKMHRVNDEVEFEMHRVTDYELKTQVMN